VRSLSYRGHYKKIRVVGVADNPGDSVLLEAEVRQGGLFRVWEERYKRNPDRVNLLTIHWELTTLNLWYYKQNPTRFFLGLGQEFVSLDEKKLKTLYLALREALQLRRKEETSPKRA
jgi:hypothetical protein